MGKVIARISTSWITVLFAVLFFVLGASVALTVIGLSTDAGKRLFGLDDDPPRTSRKADPAAKPLKTGPEPVASPKAQPPAPGSPLVADPKGGRPRVRAWEEMYESTVAGYQKLGEGLWWDKARSSIVLQAYLATPRGKLEFLLTTMRGKVHETVLYLVCTPSELDKAIREQLKLKPEKPQGGIRWFQDIVTPVGPRVDLRAEFIGEDGKTRRYAANDLVFDNTRGTTMDDVGWTYTGGRMWDNPDDSAPAFLTADQAGNVACTEHDPETLLDNPMFLENSLDRYYANPILLPKFRDWPFLLFITVRPPDKKSRTGNTVDWKAKKVYFGTGKPLVEPEMPADFYEREREAMEAERKRREEIMKKWKSEGAENPLGNSDEPEDAKKDTEPNGAESKDADEGEAPEGSGRDSAPQGPENPPGDSPARNPSEKDSGK